MKITYVLILQYLREATDGIFDGMLLEITFLGESILTFLPLALPVRSVNISSGCFGSSTPGFVILAEKVIAYYKRI